MVAQRLYSTVEVYIDYKENIVEYKKIKKRKKRNVQLHRRFGQISGTKPV